MTDNKRLMTVSVNHIIHQKKGTNFCILQCKIIENKTKPETAGSLIVCAGPFNDIHENAIYDIEGTPVLSEYTNRRTGATTKEWQLKVSNSIKSNRMCIDGILDYISRNVPSIGKAKAQKLISKYGDKTLDVVSNKTNLADVVKLIGKSSAEVLFAWSENNRENYEVRKHLYNIGLTEYQVNKIFQYFKHGIREAIKKRCFELISVPGFGFKTVCMIADKLGVAKNADGRIDACIINIIKEEIEQGNTFIYDAELLKEAVRVLNIDAVEIEARIKYMLDKREIMTEDTNVAESSYILPNGLQCEDIIDYNIKKEEEIEVIESDDMFDISSEELLNLEAFA